MTIIFFFFLFIKIAAKPAEEGDPNHLRYLQWLSLGDFLVSKKHSKLYSTMGKGVRCPQVTFERQKVTISFYFESDDLLLKFTRPPLYKNLVCPGVLPKRLTPEL
jgi:hypothetical protein